MGKRPSFIILDQDPREDFDVLLDTEAHVVFAIQDGVIVKNELPEAPPSPPDATPKRRRWVAYTPPPIAVPIRYYDSRKWNKFNTKTISGLFTGAVMLDRQFWLSQDGDSETQVGDLSEFEGGEIRAFRFGVVGTFNFKRPWVYTVFAATETFDKGFDVDTSDELTWPDYRLDIPLPADLTLSVGKQKEPISLERLTPLAFLPWPQGRAGSSPASGTNDCGISYGVVFRAEQWAPSGLAAILFATFPLRRRSSRTSRSRVSESAVLS
jgi:phosphate-selective porin OprO/OprP